MKLMPHKAAVVVLAAASALAVSGATGSAATGSNTVVNFFGNPTFSTGGQVKAKGNLHTDPACKARRVMKLQVLDVDGRAIAAIDEHLTKKAPAFGNWSLEGRLPRRLPAGTNSVRVKAKKRITSGLECRAGFSVRFPVPAARR